MVKDEDVCVHCGLCAERCPTAAWDMRKFTLEIAYAGGSACQELPELELPRGLIGTSTVVIEGGHPFEPIIESPQWSVGDDGR